MSRKNQWLIFVITLIVLILVFVAYWRFSFTGGVKLMSVHDRVTEVVKGWGRMPSLPDDTQELEVIWATSGVHFEFFPYGSQDLTTKLQNEFRDSKQTVLRFTDIYASKNPSGKIKTVDELATAVRQNYRPK